jgi:peptidoglycan hydrolase-like protein with peptidoglycan-binding domain
VICYFLNALRGIVCYQDLSPKYPHDSKYSVFVSNRPLLKLTLPENMEGKDVLDLQQALGKLGFIIEQDAKFGYQTKKAVSHFQNMKGLTPSGEVDESTWAALGL